MQSTTWGCNATSVEWGARAGAAEGEPRRWAIVTDGEPDDVVALVLFLDACVARGVQADALFILACLRDAPSTAHMIAGVVRCIYPDLRVHIGSSSDKAPFTGSLFGEEARKAAAAEAARLLETALSESIGHIFCSPNAPGPQATRDATNLVREYAQCAAGVVEEENGLVALQRFLHAPAATATSTTPTTTTIEGKAKKECAIETAAGAMDRTPRLRARDVDVLLWAPAGDLVKALGHQDVPRTTGESTQTLATPPMDNCAIREVHTWGGRGPVDEYASFNWRVDMHAARALCEWAVSQRVRLQVCTPGCYGEFKRPTAFPGARGLDARAYPDLFCALETPQRTRALPAPAATTGHASPHRATPSALVNATASGKTAGAPEPVALQARVRIVANMGIWIREWMSATPERIRVACGLVPGVLQFTQADPLSTLVYLHREKLVSRERRVDIFWKCEDEKCDDGKAAGKTSGSKLDFSVEENLASPIVFVDSVRAEACVHYLLQSWQHQIA